MFGSTFRMKKLSRARISSLLFLEKYLVNTSLKAEGVPAKIF